MIVAAVHPKLTHEVSRLCAQVDGLKPYEELRQANVISTLQLLNAASSKVSTSFVLVSTSSVATNGQPDHHARHDAQHWNSLGGYIQSKAMAEKLTVQAAQLGLKCSIVRPGLISNSNNSGVVNPADWIWRLFVGCHRIQSYPSSEATVDMNPADYVARICVLSGQSSGSDLQIYQTEMSDRLTFSDMFSLTKAAPLTVRSWHEEVERLSQTDPNLVSLSHFGNYLEQSPSSNTSSTQALLVGDPDGLPLPSAQIKVPDLQRALEWLLAQNPDVNRFHC